MHPMRRKDRLVTAEEEIRAILDKCGIVHLGLYDEDRIFVVPVNYSYEYEEGKLILYFHGARGGLKRDLIRKDNRAGFEMDTGNHVIPSRSEPQPVYHPLWLHHWKRPGDHRGRSGGKKGHHDPVHEADFRERLGNY